jgi:hypothetical protein
MLVQFSEEELLAKPLSAEQKARILELLEAGDEGIDFSDIPEVTEIPKDAVRGRFLCAAPIYLKKDMYRQLAAIAIRKGVSLNYLVGQLLQKELEIAEVLA